MKLLFDQPTRGFGVLRGDVMYASDLCETEEQAGRLAESLRHMGHDAKAIAVTMVLDAPQYLDSGPGPGMTYKLSAWLENRPPAKKRRSP